MTGPSTTTEQIAEAHDAAQLVEVDSRLPDLYASAPEPLPFAPSLAIRSFLLRREAGNVLVYATKGLDAATGAIEELGGVSRWYLNHHHEAGFAPGRAPAPLFVHEREREGVETATHVRATFSRRHQLDDDLEVIPTPGHTAGATAYLWTTGDRRLLFTGDTIYIRDGDWHTAVLESSDVGAYLESLELIRELDFDVLVPWAASGDGPFHTVTDRAVAQNRIDAILSRLRSRRDRR